MSIANAATFTVTKTADMADGTCDADCSLREAVIAANALGGADTIKDNPLTLTDISLIGNVAQDGGAISISAGDGSLAANRVTMSGNSATKRGGAVYGSGGVFHIDHLALINTTIADNTAPVGGGIWESPGQEFIATNTIIANNTGGDCVTTIDSGGNNIDSDNTCRFATNADPKLGPPQNNTVRTDTMALLEGSPAVENGTNTGCPATDQRNVARPDGLLCDIGAYEGEVHFVSGRVFEDANFTGNDNDTDSIITQNSFCDNGPITSRNGGGETGKIGIDLNGTGLFAAGPEAPKR